jgi:2-methylcitrate dehydratase PrpD
MDAILKPTEDLARFASETTYDRLPASARDFARHLLLDSIACALAGDLGDETSTYAAFARVAGGAGDSTIIGSSDRLSLLGASLLNGYLITAVTVCDTYMPGQAHISPEVIPPALAVAERDGHGGRALLAAIAIGAEVATRVAAGIDYSVAGPLGWHLPGIIGPFGAAAAVGRLRGLTPLQMRNAFGLAGSQAAGSWASWGTPTVKFHQSRGAASGLLAGLLAEQDFAASAEVLNHADGGVFKAYSDGGRPEAAIEGLGERFEFEQISLRLWPGTAPAQAALTAISEIVASAPPAFEDIEEVLIEVPPHIHAAHDRFVRPAGKFDALLSFHFMVAVFLRDRALWLPSLDQHHVDDPELGRFMRERLKLVPDKDQTSGRSRVTVRRRGGEARSLQIDAARGGPGNPATLDDLQAKYARCVDGRLSPLEADELLDLVIGIDARDELGRLFELLGSARERTR